MSYDYQQLESDLSELLGAMSNFTASETAEVAQFLAAGEYGLAFETLCGIAKEEDKPVLAKLRPKLRDLGKRMEIDPIWWAELTKDG
jgi:uncharacterized alpha-E superfamily protein